MNSQQNSVLLSAQASADAIAKLEASSVATQNLEEKLQFKLSTETPNIKPFVYPNISFEDFKNSVSEDTWISIFTSSSNDKLFKKVSHVMFALLCTKTDKCSECLKYLYRQLCNNITCTQSSDYMIWLDALRNREFGFKYSTMDLDTDLESLLKSVDEPTQPFCEKFLAFYSEHKIADNGNEKLIVMTTLGKHLEALCNLKNFPRPPSSLRFIPNKHARTNVKTGIDAKAQVLPGERVFLIEPIFVRLYGVVQGKPMYWNIYEEDDAFVINGIEEMLVNRLDWFDTTTVGKRQKQVLLFQDNGTFKCSSLQPPDTLFGTNSVWAILDSFIIVEPRDPEVELPRYSRKAYIVDWSSDKSKDRKSVV